MEAFKFGFPKAAYVGSCAMVALVIDSKLYVANSGDSKAVLLRHDEESGSLNPINVTTTYNANKKSE